MPNITDQMIAQYQHPRIKLVIGGTTIYEDDIVSGSFSYRGGTTGGGAFAPGGCVISSASFSVYNRTGSYTNTFAEGTEVQIYIGYGATPSTATYDLLCTVYVADATKRNYKIAVSCYDKLRDADKEKWTTYSFPMTVREIIQSAATEAGITVNTLPPNTVAGGGGISVDLRDDEGNQPDLSMTCRQAIAQALLISGHFGYMTTSGQLYCGWYGSSVDKTIQTSWIFDYNVSDAQDYTGVQVYGQTPSGTSTRLYVLSSGRFITEANCADIQARLYSALVTQGLSIRKGTFSMVCNPNVRPGQIVQVTVPMAGSNVTMTIPLTSVVIKGSLKATYSAEAVSADTQDDLRKAPDYATKEDVEKAMNKLTPSFETVVLPSCEINIELDSNNNPTFGTFNGLSIETDQPVDQYHSVITGITLRNSTNPNTEEIGIDVMKITFPEQTIRVPAVTGQADYVDILVGTISVPTLAEYRAKYGNSYTNAMRLARICTFMSEDSNPVAVKVRVKRFKGVNTYGVKYDFIKFTALSTQDSSYSSYMLRTTFLFNGLDGRWALIPSIPTRIPYVNLPLPGQCFDLCESTEEGHTATAKKWCWQYSALSTRIALRAIPATYITYR